jgi:hypothetical protein
MLAMTAENYQVTRTLGHTLLGLRTRHRKKAERMAVGDRVLYYVLGERVFPATGTVTSAYFEDRHQVWHNAERGDDHDAFPYRVHTRPSIVLEPWEALDAAAIAPRMMYVKRWPPEQWYLAFQGDVHLLSAQDFLLVEAEMVRIVDSRGRRRERPPRSLSVGIGQTPPLAGSTRGP